MHLHCHNVYFCALCSGRSVDNLSEPMLTKFEQLAEKQKFGLAYLFPFPTYSMCIYCLKKHVINVILLNSKN